MKHIGDLIITKENQKDFKKLTEVSGYVYVYEGATFTAPKLTEVSGSVYVYEGATFTAPKLTEVSGSVYVRQGATFTAPKLEKSGYIDVRQGATFTAPKLTEVSGSVYVYEGATFTAPKLTEVSGSVYVYEGATFTAPKLEKSGYVDVRQGATFTAPKLTEVSGSVYVRQGATFNTNLTKKLNYKSVDNSLFVIESEKTSKGIKIYSGYNIVKITDGKLVKESCYVSKKEGFTAHGKTIKKSINDLQFKIVSEKLKKEPINKDTMVDINHYRLLTGACEMGVNSWMKENNMTKESYRADELLTLLEKTNAYGINRFKELINF